MKILKTILFTLFALMFINAGLDKFLHYMPVPELPEETQKVFTAIMQIPWLLPLVGAMELTGGLLALFSENQNNRRAGIISCNDRYFSPKLYGFAGNTGNRHRRNSVFNLALDPV